MRDSITPGTSSDSVVPSPTRRAKAEPRWQRRKQARPAELLSAALAVFVERGFALTRLEDVAARAGVAKGTVYLYYSSKEELFKAVVRDGLSAPLAEARDLLATSNESSVALLTRILRYWRTQFRNSPVAALPKLIITEAGNFPELVEFYINEIDGPRQQLMETLIRRGIGRGEFASLPVAETARYLSAPMLLLALFENPHGGISPPGFDGETYFENALVLLLKALAPVEGTMNPGSRK